MNLFGAYSLSNSNLLKKASAAVVAYVLINAAIVRIIIALRKQTGRTMI